jgi:hypothetical protein
MGPKAVCEGANMTWPGGWWLILLVSGGSLFAAETPPPKKGDPAQVRRWIAELDHDDFAVREAATEALSQTSADGLPDLMKAIRGGSPEVAVRATQVLAAWYAQPEQPAIAAVEDAFETLIARGGTVGDQALLACNSQRRIRDGRSLAELERLGAGLKYHDQPVGFPRDDPPVRQKYLQHIVISRKWTGGDDGLKHVRRLDQPQQVPVTVYRVNGNTVSDAAFQALEDAGLRVEKRGAKLGVGSSSGFDLNPRELAGFRISTLEPGSAADKHGLMIDDTIIEFEDKPVTDFTDLVTYLLDTKPGDKVTFTIVRDRKKQRVVVELGDW